MDHIIFKLCSHSKLRKDLHNNNNEKNNQEKTKPLIQSAFRDDVIVILQ